MEARLIEQRIATFSHLFKIVTNTIKTLPHECDVTLIDKTLHVLTGSQQGIPPAHVHYHQEMYFKWS